MPDIDDATRQERRKKAGDYLKMADKLFKGGDIEGAARLVQMATTVDAQNPYAIAYAERLKLARDQKTSPTASATASGKRPIAIVTASQNKPINPPPTPATAKRRPGIEAGSGSKAIPEEVRRIAELEAQRKNLEEQAKRAEEDFKKKEEESKRKLEDAARLIEDQKKHLEEEKKRRGEIEENLRTLTVTQEKQFGDELTHRLDEERGRLANEFRRRLDSERSRIEAEFAARLRQERDAVQEVKRRDEEGVASRQRMEEHQARALEEAKAGLEAERRRLREEADAQLAEERTHLEKLRQQEEAAAVERRRAAEQQLRLLQEDLRKKMEEELRNARTTLEEDFRRQLTEERRRMEEDRRHEISELQDTQRQVEEETRKRLEEEHLKRLALEREHLNVELRTQLDIERKKIEEEAYRKAEDLARSRHQEDERAATEMRVKAEEERRKQEVEQEDRRKTEAEEMQKYEDAVRQAIEEGQRVAKTKKLRDYLDRAAKALSEEKFDDALREITRALHLEPSNAEALDLEQTVYTVRDETVRRREQAGRRAEQRRKLDELQRRLEEQARADAEVQKERALREAKSAALVHKIKELNRTGRYDAALSELENLYTIDPGNSAGREIEMKIIAQKQSSAKADLVSAQRSAEGESWRQREEGQDLERQVDRDRLKQDAASTYRTMLRQAWADGVPASDDKAMIEVVRLSLGIDERERSEIEKEIRNESYAEAFKSAWRNGIVNPSDENTVEPLRNVFGLSGSEARDIESTITRKRS